MDRHRYPAADGHRLEHSALLDAIARLLLDFERGRPISGSLMALLQHWLTDHIGRVDKALARTSSPARARGDHPVGRGVSQAPDRPVMVGGVFLHPLTLSPRPLGLPRFPAALPREPSIRAPRSAAAAPSWIPVRCRAMAARSATRSQSPIA